MECTFSGSCPDDRGGAALLPEDVRENVGVNHMQKVSCKGGIGDNSGQTARGSGAPLVGFSRRQFYDAVWEPQRVLFLSKKVAKWYKNLTTVKSRDPKLKKQTAATEKHVVTANEQIPLKANGSLLAPAAYPD
jgi:hypothetical protein